MDEAEAEADGIVGFDGAAPLRLFNANGAHSYPTRAGIAHQGKQGASIEQDSDLVGLLVRSPARWLDDRNVKLPAARYQAILKTIINTITRHGDVGKIRSFGRYLLHCVQAHLQHHGEECYEAAKAFRSLADDALHGVSKKKQQVAAARAAEADQTIPSLAAAHRLLAASKGGRRRKPAPPESQQADLF